MIYREVAVMETDTSVKDLGLVDMFCTDFHAKRNE